MALGCYLDAQAALSTVVTEQEALWATELVWTFCRTENLLAPTGIRNLDSPSRNPVIPATQSRFLLLINIAENRNWQTTSSCSLHVGFSSKLPQLSRCLYSVIEGAAGCDVTARLFLSPLWMSVYTKRLIEPLKRHRLHSFICGNYPSVFIAYQTTLVRSNTTRVYFNSVGYLHLCAACFGLYLDHPQACQYRNPTKEDTYQLNYHRSVLCYAETVWFFQCIDLFYTSRKCEKQWSWPILSC